MLGLRLIPSSISLKLDKMWDECFVSSASFETRRSSATAAIAFAYISCPRCKNMGKCTINKLFEVLRASERKHLLHKATFQDFLQVPVSLLTTMLTAPNGNPQLHLLIHCPQPLDLLR